MTDLERELKIREASRKADTYEQAMDEALAERDAQKLATNIYLWALESAIARYLHVRRPEITVTDEQIERLQRILAEEHADEGEGDAQ